jgi:pyruvate/2-oxoglutarate dehydrogenase complex dihydrolipoamide acyltransferase (E2) component
MIRVALCRRMANRRFFLPGYSTDGQVFGTVDHDSIDPCKGEKYYNRSWISSCASLWSTLQVKVPPLGESITDGTVAAILRQAGDHVEEDDPLIQIETDKVTVDVRTPVAGTVKSVLVSTGDTVAVDHVVAVITEGEAAGRVESSDVTMKDIPKPKKEVRTRDPGPPVNEGQTVAAPSDRAHVPLISFPSRRTAGGVMISDLSEAEQKQIRNDEISAMHSAAFFMKKMPKIEEVSLPPRRVLTEKEMEMIMLGGAE